MTENIQLFLSKKKKMHQPSEILQQNFVTLCDADGYSGKNRDFQERNMLTQN